MLEPCMEHVDNNFNPLPKEYIKQFHPICQETEKMLDQVHDIITSGDFSNADSVLVDGNALKAGFHKCVMKYRGNYKRKTAISKSYCYILTPCRKRKN